MGIWKEILLDSIIVTAGVAAAFWTIGFMYAWDETSPFKIRGNRGYKKSWIERFIDAWEFYHNC